MFFICQQCGDTKVNPDGSRERLVFDSLESFAADHFWAVHKNNGQLVIRIVYK